MDKGIESDLRRIGAGKSLCIILSALALTIAVCMICRSWFVQEVVLVDCLAPEDDLVVSAAVVYYKSDNDPQFSERQKCRQVITANDLRKNRNHVMVEVPLKATECCFNLYFDRPVPTKSLPIEFYTREGEKTLEMKITSWNKTSMTIILTADDFRKVCFFGLRFFSFSTLVFLCAFAVGLFVVNGVRGAWGRRGGLLLVSVFILLLLAPNKEITEEDASASENRNRARFPDMSQFGFLDVSSYCKRLSEAYQDRFWGRDDLISIHNSILKTFDTGRGNDKALIGRNNWLFYMQTLEDFSNKAKPYDDEIFNAIYEKLKAFSEYAHRNGKVFVFFVAPDKCRVYPEYVRGYSKKKSDDESRMELLISRLRERCDFPIVYPRRLMLELKKKMPYPLYYKNDTHWTEEAAYYAGYKEIMTAIMNDKFYKGDLKVFEIDKWRTEKLYNGDLNRMLPSQSMREEQDYNFPVVDDKGVTRKVKTVKIKTKNMTIPFSIISSTNNDGSGSLFCFGDSFSTRFLSFFEHSFKSFYRAPVSTGLSEENRQVLKESEVIVLELVERNLISSILAIDPKSL